jgi:cell division protein FtsI/penicillin-binding protein 2
MLQGSDLDRPVSIKAEKMRRYIQGTSLCHIIGQLGPVQASELSSRPAGEPDEQQLKDYYLGDRQGSWGIECVFEDYLRGSRGWEQRSLDKEIAPQRRIEPVYGSDVFLTVDIDLQEQVAAVIAGKNCLETSYYGSVVVIDMPTGEVRSMVSVPVFDLNTYYQYDQFKTINDENDPQNRKTNRGLSVNYCPGSTIKPMMLLGALEMALVNGNTSLYCPGRDPDKPPPQCWSIYGHGDINAHRAICESCNSYFIQVSQLMGPQRAVDWLKLIGMGRCIMAWPGQIEASRIFKGFRETAGNIAPQGQDIPSKTTLRFMSIGRGALDGSILQIANNMATIARNGYFQGPVLVTYPQVDSPPVKIASLNNVKLIQDAMKAVIYEPTGTAYKAFNPPIWPEQEVTLFGKTGSTENSLFGCFARAADGRCLAIAVVLDTEAHGTEVAAPLAGDILKVCGRLGYLPKPAETTDLTPDETVGR